MWLMVEPLEMFLRWKHLLVNKDRFCVNDVSKITPQNETSADLKELVFNP